MSQFSAYENHPVTETVAGVEFAPVPATFVSLAQFVADQSAFPVTSEQIPLPPSVPMWRAAGPEIKFNTVPDAPRLWSASTDQHLLLQIQRDRLLLNWRRLDAQSGSYPGYESIRDEFGRLLGDFRARFAEASLRPLVVEWTYMNSVEHPATHVTGWQEPKTELPGSAAFSVYQHMRDLGEDTGARGQLSISGEPMNPGGSGQRLRITVQFFVTDSETDTDVISLLDKAHDASRACFDAVTSDEGKEDWGRW